MNNEFLDAFRSLKIEDDKTIIAKLDVVTNYLNSLNQRLSKKRLKENFIMQNIFSTPKSERDIDKYVKANLSAAASSLSRIISMLKSQPLTDFNKRLISDFICDLKPYIQRFDEQQKFAWLLFNSNTHVTNFYYELSKNIFFRGEPGEHQVEHLVLNTSTPFVIRQCIEYRIKEILGVEPVLVNNIYDIRIIEKCFKVLKGNSHLYKSIKFDISIVRCIYKWTHEYIHGGFRSVPWKTETALKYLGLLFYETKTPTSFSMYGAVEADKINKDALKKNTEEEFRKLISGDFSINWHAEPIINFT